VGQFARPLIAGASAAAAAPVTAATALSAGTVLPVTAALGAGIAAGTAINRANPELLQGLFGAGESFRDRYSSKNVGIGPDGFSRQTRELAQRQNAPGSTPAAIPAGSASSNRAAEINRMNQQGGGSPLQSRTASAWDPGMREYVQSIGNEAASQRQANVVGGRPAIWGMDSYPEINPGTEVYWKRPDIQKWANANERLANELRQRKGLPALRKNADGSLIFDGDNVSPYADAFSQDVPAELRGRSMQDVFGQQPLDLAYKSSGMSFTPEQFTGGAPTPSAAAYSAPTVSTSFNRQQGAQPVASVNVPVAQAFESDALLAPANFKSSVQVDPSMWSRGADKVSDAYDAELDPSNEFLRRFRDRARRPS
jgi:hypothetical protein